MDFVHGSNALLPDLTFGDAWNNLSPSSELPGIGAGDTMSLGDLNSGLSLCMDHNTAALGASGFQQSMSKSNMSQLDAWSGSSFLPLGTFDSTNSGFDLNFGGIPNYMVPNVPVPSTNSTPALQLPVPSLPPQLTLTTPHPAIGTPLHQPFTEATIQPVTGLLLTEPGVNNLPQTRLVAEQEVEGRTGLSLGRSKRRPMPSQHAA